MAFPQTWVGLTAPSLTNWQFQYAGLTFGHLQSVKIKQVNGLGDLPPIQGGDQQRSRDHGEWVGLDVYGGRDFTIDLEAETSSGGIAATLQTLAAAALVGFTTETAMWFQLPGYPLLGVMCRPRKRSTPFDVGYQIGNVAVVPTAWHSTDPRLYGFPKTATISLPNPTSGMTFPATFPLTFGASPPNGATLTNGGNTETRPLLVITGPVTNPSIQNATLSGAPTITLSNPNQTSYTVLAGDQLTVDLDSKAITYYVGGVSAGNGAPRGSWLVHGSTWWTLQPGGNLVQFLSKDSASVAGTVQVQWSDGWVL